MNMIQNNHVCLPDNVPHGVKAISGWPVVEKLICKLDYRIKRSARLVAEFVAT